VPPFLPSSSNNHFVSSALARLALSQIIIIIVIYSLKIEAGQQGRISGTYNCPQCKIKSRNIKYRELSKTSWQSQHSNIEI